jgi:hypothetical protein
VADLLKPQPIHSLEPAGDPAQSTLTKATRALMARQHKDGHWRFDLEADATIPSEYLMLHYFMGTVDAVREKRIAVYLRRRQHENGSWSLYEGGPGDISATPSGSMFLPGSHSRCSARCPGPPCPPCPWR